MSQLELFTDTERVALRLQREPAAVCAETLHRIRLSVKADRLWRIRIPHAAFAELGVEPEDIAHIPIPTLLLNGEPIVTMGWRDQDSFVLTPVVSIANTRPAVLFKDSIGAVSLSVDSSIGAIHTEAFFLSLKRGFVADYVSKMADYVVDRLNVWAKAPTPGEYLTAPAEESTFATELQNRLDSIERTLKTFEQLLPYFRTNAKFELVSQETVDGVGRLTGFSHSTLRHVIEHPEDLVTSSHGTGIRIHNRYYMPRHTLVETKRKTFDLPENRLMLGFLECVTEVLEAEVEAVGARRSQLPELLKVEDEYVSSAEAIMGVVLKRLKNHQSQLEALLSHAKRISGQYRQVLPVTPAPYGETPVPSKVFLTIPAYRLVYQCMCDWQKMGPLHLVDEGLLLTTFERSRLYELFCLFKLVDDLRTAGFDVIEHRRCVYSARPPHWLQSPVPNTFVLEKRSDGKTVSRVTVFYEPFICSPMRSLENGVDLVRTSPFTWEDGVARMTDPQVSFVTPDYVVRLETEDRVRWFIADAKYTEGWNAVSSQTRELLFKYLYSVCPVKEAETIEGLWILYGWLRPDSTPIPATARKWAPRPGVDVHYEEMSPYVTDIGRLAATIASLS